MSYIGFQPDILIYLAVFKQNRCLKPTKRVTCARSTGILLRSTGVRFTTRATQLQITVIKNLRNIAIIAHVDHGKTTLVDQLLQQSGTMGEHAATLDRAMDSNELEKERGITILSKNASLAPIVLRLSF